MKFVDSLTMEKLEDIYDALRPYMPFVLAGGCVVLTGVIAHKVISKGMRMTGPGNIKAPPDTPIIYQITRGPNAPSMSPFPMKLEMFCRLAKIPYLVDCTGRFSSRGKIPWMTYNDEVVEDSQMCIEYLTKKTGVDVNSHLNAQQRAVSQMIRVMVDEHLYWPTALFRWVYYDKSFPQYATKELKLPYPVLRMFSRLIGNQGKAQGIGRHSEEEIRAIMMSDLKCLSDFLENKPYMLGDKMCEADCAVFGLLAQFEFHHFNGAPRDVLHDKFPNLQQYVLRIKDEVWPDWDDLCKPNADGLESLR